MMHNQELLRRFVSRSTGARSVDAIFASLARIATTDRVAAGRPAEIDESEDHLVFVSNGCAKLVAHASDGRDQVISFHFSGDSLCVPGRARHSYSLCMLADSDLLIVPYERLVEVASNDAPLLSHLLAVLRLSLSRCRRKVISLGRKNASERFAAFLLDMGERIGSSDGPTIRMTLPMSRRDIGDNLGLTIETVSRQFTQFRELGLVETSGRFGVKLLDPEGLESRAGYMRSTR